jgi:hypothetical protein
MAVPYDLVPVFQIVVYRNDVVQAIPVNVSDLPVTGGIIVNDDVFKGYFLRVQFDETEQQGEKEYVLHKFWFRHSLTIM